MQMATPEVEVLDRIFQTKSQIQYLEEKTRSFVQTFIEDKSQLLKSDTSPYENQSKSST